MQRNSRILDDLGQLMTNAMGVAQGARSEAEAAFRSRLEHWLHQNGLASGRELDALGDEIGRLRAANAALVHRVEVLEAALGRGGAEDDESAADEPPAPLEP